MRETTARCWMTMMRSSLIREIGVLHAIICASSAIARWGGWWITGTFACMGSLYGNQKDEKILYFHQVLVYH